MKIFRYYSALFLSFLLLALLLAACGGTVTTNPGETQDDCVTGDAALSDSVQESPGTDDPAILDDPTDGLAAEMPVIRIDTGGQPIVSKEYYIDGNLSLDNTREEYALTDAAIEIRGRGNYSWFDTEKKSYRIKFAEKTNLLGQGAGPARSWTLLAVHCDQSLLRNAAAFYLARHLDGIGYTSSVSFAKLYLNGSYEGVYQVSEQMQIQKYRVNVDDKAIGPEVGFLLELDAQANFYNTDYFVSDGDNTYEVKNDLLTDEQYAYIYDFMYSAWEAVRWGDRADVEELIDLDSVVDTYLVEEVMKNLDVGWGSFYMYKDVGGKLHFGPVWDFDLSSGNALPDDKDMNFVSPKYLYVGNSYYTYQQQHRWFVTLMELDWFQDLVKARWAEVKDIMDSVPVYVRAVAELYSEEFDENFERWPIFGQKINREPNAVLALHSHDEQVEYLAGWLEQRIAWMDSYMKGEVGANPAEPGEFVGSGGEGSLTSPYLISTPDDFASLTDAMRMGDRFEGCYFLQTADIDMAGYFGYAGIGSEALFAGVYDGGGHTLHVVIASSDGCPFPYVSGIVMNVITTGSVTNDAQAAGIARSVRAGGLILNCASYAEVTSRYENAGGIVASNQAGGGVMGCVFGGKVEAAGGYGPINYYIRGRDGIFADNYYFDAPYAGSVTLGDERAIGGEGITLDSVARALNEARVSFAEPAPALPDSAFCAWRVENGRLLLSEKETP